MRTLFPAWVLISVLALVGALVAIYHKEGEVKFEKRSGVFIGVGILVVLSAWVSLHPGWESPASIRESLLRMTPPGTSIDGVLSLAQKRGWVQRNASVNYQPADQYPCTLSGVLRHDPLPYRTSVWAHWVFNRSNQLAEITVSRYE